MVEQSSPIAVYQLHVWLREITPLIWRRLLVRSDSAIADLHDTLQIVMGWDDAHLHRFHIRGQDVGLSRSGGIGFHDDPRQGYLADFHCRRNEHFLYEDDFGDLWHQVVRVERRLPLDRKRTDPVCLGGKRAAPPEDCGGPWAFMARQDQYSPGSFLDRYADLLETIQAGDLDEARDQLTELEPLEEWLALEHFDRRQMNRRLNLYTLGCDPTHDDGATRAGLSAATSHMCGGRQQHLVGDGDSKSDHTRFVHMICWYKFPGTLRFPL